MKVESGSTLYSRLIIFTSLDRHFAVSDALTRALSTVQNRLLVSSPWLGKGFVDLMRKTVADGVSIWVLTRIPKENYDTSFDAISSLYEIAEEHNWKLKVNCISEHHPKFLIVDNTSCITGSLNPTESGMYYNLELGFVHMSPCVIERLVGFFFDMTRQSVDWQQAKQSHGYEKADQGPSFNRIAEKYVEIFFGNGNTPLRKSEVCRVIVSQGFEERDIVTVGEQLLRRGVLYEPKLDWICLACDSHVC